MTNQKEAQLTWKEAVMSTKGPSTARESVILFIKGLFMGAANIIPGVSGGTIALITGIYQDLLFAIRSVNLDTLRLVKQMQIKQAVASIHVKFLVVLTIGVGVAILSLAHFMNFVFKAYPIFTWSFFFGLIIASIVVMGVKTKKWLGTGGIAFVLGTLFSFFFVGLIPVTTPDSWWFIVLAGGVVICTMILPGLSGAFLLLILGKYEYITSALKNPFSPGNLYILTLFSVGCLAGIIAFSRLLSYMLKHWENVTMAMLTGIMCGSLRKIWPWKEVLETRMIRGKEYILKEANVLPAQIDIELMIAIGLALVGFLIVLVLERTADSK